MATFTRMYMRKMREIWKPLNVWMFWVGREAEVLAPLFQGSVLSLVVSTPRSP